MAKHFLHYFRFYSGDKTKIFMLGDNILVLQYKTKFLNIICTLVHLFHQQNSSIKYILLVVLFLQVVLKLESIVNMIPFLFSKIINEQLLLTLNLPTS